MSRMTKFLKQTCMVESYNLDSNGNPERNRFGELVYQAPVKCKCRHEISSRDFQVANGNIIRSTARYFLDESFPILPDYKIDGHVLINVEEYVNQLGHSEGYEVYV